MDMLNGRYEAISQRITEQGNGCLAGPEMTSWLLNLAPDIEAQGGPAAREKLYQLTIRLAPTCPQPYGQLGTLYENNRAFWAATLQYRKAAELAGNTPLAGFYYYKEGLTHVRYTGNLDQAIYALENAERLQTWVTGVVFQGAAAYNLGLALRDSGQLDEAAAAFQRVIDCDSCVNYQKPAQAALRTLSES
jgi:tetratricopeptide (TPR) repeat protein